MPLFSGIRRNVFILGIVSLLTDISSEMIFPILPSFFTAVLGASVSLLGITAGVEESASSILKLLSGAYSDRAKRKKPLVVLGYSLSSLSKPLLALSSIWYHVLFIRFLDRVGKGIRAAPRDAILVQESEQRVRGKAFGFHRAMDTLGAVLGPLVAIALLIQFGSDYRLIFLLAGIPALLSVAFLLIFLREKDGSKTASKLPSLSPSSYSPEFLRLLAVVALFGLANMSVLLFIKRGQELLGAGDVFPGISPLIGSVALYLCFNIIYALFAMPAGMLSDRFGRKSILLAGYLLFSLVAAGFAFGSGPLLVLALFILYGIFKAITEPVQAAFASDLSHEARLGASLGMYHLTAGIAALPASAFAGFLWDSFGAWAAFSFAAALALISTALLLILFRGKN